LALRSPITRAIVTFSVPVDLVVAIHRFESFPLLAADATMMSSGVGSPQGLMDNVEVAQQIEFVGNHVAHTDKMRLTIQSDVESFGALYSQCAKCARKSQTIIIVIHLFFCINTRITFDPLPF
jgi:hypothetical protein